MTDQLVVGGGVLGQQVEGHRRVLDQIPLEPSIASIEYTSDEVYSHCPATGQPDFYVVAIQVTNPQFGIESKSLKLYLQSFEDREDAQFCEKFADTICKAVLDCCKPYRAIVTLKQKPRGGVSVIATSSIQAEITVNDDDEP